MFDAYLDYDPFVHHSWCIFVFQIHPSNFDAFLELHQNLSIQIDFFAQKMNFCSSVLLIRMHGNFFEANHERKQWVFM